MFERAVDIYINKVKTILKICDGEYLQECKRIILELFERTEANSIKGIVVGVLFHDNLPRKKDGCFVSNGRNTVTDSDEQTHMINELRNMYNEDKKIIFLRFPFFSCDDDDKFQLLVKAFEPVFQCYLCKIIYSKKSKTTNPLATPILTLGYVAAEATYNCVKKTNRPEFVIIPTVHPNFMTHMKVEMDQSKVEEDKKFYKKCIADEFLYFKLQLILFKEFVNVKSSITSS